MIIWLLAIGQIMQHFDNFLCYLAYGLGFATGNYVGIYLEELLSSALVEHLRSLDFGVSTVDIEGKSGKLKMLFTIINRKDIKEVVSIINRHDPHAFFTSEDIRSSNEGFFRLTRKRQVFLPMSLFLDNRKGK